MHTILSFLILMAEVQKISTVYHFQFLTITQNNADTQQEKDSDIIQGGKGRRIPVSSRQIWSTQ